MKHVLCIAGILVFSGSAHADPSLECGSAGSQVEIRECLAETTTRVEEAMRIALGIATEAAEELDEVTGRESAQPALAQSQTAWENYKTAHCDFVGSTFGGGSGTGIAIASCQIELTRQRTRELMDSAR
ncbi:MAG: DUF1311 domain-containing protein [Rhodobacteraceae bacterium]|nr:DUF1311 domain-containing protein [Paracoccaceae bacterium]